jgi:hypothetical protein
MKLRTILNGCEMFNLVKEDYLNILREDFDEFKIIFAAWIKTFDKSDVYDDGRGLFY